ncbi:reverse transcriptase domain-containing protein [Paraflavitalea speifideaquila]|uniref:reverse transcriptase domain-containing protein n=1 Tax=Paraflavitalea speifideaquila TaxID=3076558 RepID=UPI0028E8574E|nr:reverse transcriptase domain-containing protein [Paraflavitalea speifideiaquila]
MKGRKQKISQDNFLQKNRTASEDYVGVQTSMWITENNLTSVEQTGYGMLEQILSPANLNAAYKRVIQNKGAGGVDEMEVGSLKDYLIEQKEALITSILAGTYRPNPVRRVLIPKEDGRQRQLGIPTVVDRVIQQAITQVLSPVYEKQFSSHSYGFRPKRSAHQALRQCQRYITEGYNYAVDLDLEKFFDTVNQSKLVEVLCGTIKDGRVISLIHRYLQAGVITANKFETTVTGVPQGGPLALRTHPQTLSFPGGHRLKGVNFYNTIKSSTFMINGKITEFGISQTHQPGFCSAAKGQTSAADCRAVDAEVWGISNPGLSLYPISQGNQRKDVDTGKFCRVYRQVATYTDQADKEAIGIQRVIDQQGGPYCAGRIFSKVGSCPKRRNKLRYHLPMTGCGSKSSRRYIISSFPPTGQLFSLNKFLLN